MLNRFIEVAPADYAKNIAMAKKIIAELSEDQNKESES